LEADVDVLTIQKILGHRSLNTTAIYTHVRRDHLQAAARVLDLLPLERIRRIEEHASPLDATRLRPQ
jgi:integrase